MSWLHWSPVLGILGLLFYGGQDLQDEFATLPETGEDKDYDMCVSRKISDVAIE